MSILSPNNLNEQNTNLDLENEKIDKISPYKILNLTGYNIEVSNDFLKSQI